MTNSDVAERVVLFLLLVVLVLFIAFGIDAMDRVRQLEEELETVRAEAAKTELRWQDAATAAIHARGWYWRYYDVDPDTLAYALNPCRGDIGNWNYRECPGGPVFIPIKITRAD